jgi:hypothetical protein
LKASGFPADPSLWRVLLVWLYPSAIAVAAFVVAFRTSRRRQLDDPRWVLSVFSVVAFVVPAFFLLFPTQWREAAGTVVEYPQSGAAGSVMPGDRNGELYRAWEPCVAASRRHVAVSTGAYAVVAGVVGLMVLRVPMRDGAAPEFAARSASRTSE